MTMHLVHSILPIDLFYRQSEKRAPRLHSVRTPEDRGYLHSHLPYSQRYWPSTAFDCQAMPRLKAALAPVDRHAKQRSQRYHRIGGRITLRIRQVGMEITPIFRRSHRMQPWCSLLTLTVK